VVKQYHDMFDACDVPERTRKMMVGGMVGGTLAAF